MIGTDEYQGKQGFSIMVKSLMNNLCFYQKENA
ncbi:hypothetical protein Q667_15960 [Marinobacter sp. C1S70]|nr:hypothetical protein Q673_02550 [Marinobacter sp. EN3]ERS86882.1 hypothetical protein Q667_15960 [Marinobacter sp. C1S70]